MPGIITVTCRDFEVEKHLTRMRRDNYLDAKLDLRNMEGRERYVTIKFWRQRQIKKKVGRPRNA